jgi:hypothetical protein
LQIRNIKHWWLWPVTLAGAVLAFYVVTVGLAESIVGNIEVGRLSWLRSDATLDILDAYVVPARSLVDVPGVDWLFKLSEACWGQVTGAPICVKYGTHLQQIPIANVPSDLMKVFTNSYPKAEVVRVSKELGGRKGTQFIFWVILFKDEGKLREALMPNLHKVPMAYDVQSP